MATTASSLPPEGPTPTAPVPSLAQALHEDDYWRRFFWRERYYRASFGYEDYAPAYCVGYVGFAQYGGSFEDAERSLVANWLRIRGDSQLSLEEAGLAMRAAWRRMAQAAQASAQWSSQQVRALTGALERQDAATARDEVVLASPTPPQRSAAPEPLRALS